MRNGALKPGLTPFTLSSFHSIKALPTRKVTVRQLHSTFRPAVKIKHINSGRHSYLTKAGLNIFALGVALVTFLGGIFLKTANFSTFFFWLWLVGFAISILLVVTGGIMWGIGLLIDAFRS